MPRTYLITTLDLPDGGILTLVRRDGAYIVGRVSPHGRAVALKDATFWTYDAALTRLHHERQGVGDPNPANGG